MKIDRQSVLDAVASHFSVAAERDKRFGPVVVDLYLPAPLNCIVQFDDTTHCTRERAATFAHYSPDTPLNYDLRRYLADEAPGDPAVAQADVLIDLLASKHGLNPTVRIRADEVAELDGSLTERIDSLLSRRFAYHAGTTFHLMLENAGAKPHRTRVT